MYILSLRRCTLVISFRVIWGDDNLVETDKIKKGLQKELRSSEQILSGLADGILAQLLNSRLKLRRITTMLVTAMVIMRCTDGEPFFNDDTNNVTV